MNPGTQLGPYRVESLIGAGGMGEVYLGMDTRLDRQVAIKILSGQLAGDPALRERFEREARTISSLSHPNICTLFDLGRHDGSDYLVMEYLQGETLADRIARGPLPPQQVIRIGLGIASALEAAHRQGIVHRDLKPGNVMLTKSGIKLLDFGLAKLSASSTSSTSGVTLGATEQKPLTEQGTILGTFQYMAPEQLEGQAADARTDIFAFGAILYEMATGRRAFQGATKASLIAAIIDRDPPPMTELQPLTPAALERVVRACLAKDPEDRIQTAHDVALELKWISESSSAAEPVAVRHRKKITPWIVAAAFAVLAAATGLLWWRERSRTVVTPYSFSIYPSKGMELRGAGLSPDGRLLAFAQWQETTNETTLWLRRLDDGTVRQLASKADGRSPFWSPDGKWIGFFQSGRIMRVPAGGGSPETICTSPLQGSGTWSEDGTILFTPSFGVGLSRVPANGGDPVPVTRLDASRQESGHLTPRFLPGGKQFLYVVHTISEKRNEIWARSLSGGKAVKVITADALVGYAAPHLLYVRDGGIYAQRFDPDDLRLSGEATRVVDNVDYSESEGAAAAIVSPNGVLIYGPHIRNRFDVNVYDRSGKVLSTIWSDDDIGTPTLSGDEQTLVLNKVNPTKGAADIYSIDLGRKLATRVTSGLSANINPRVSYDGQSIAFQSDRAGMFDLYLTSVDGSSGDRVVWKDNRDKSVWAWSSDGKFLLAGRFTPETRWDLYVVPLDPAQKPRLFVSTPVTESAATFSPDGKWVTYLVETDEGGQELYLRPVAGGRALRVSRDGGNLASWTADGKELLWATKKRVMSATVDLTGAVPRVDPPKELFQGSLWSRPIPLRDGRILGIAPAAETELLVPFEFTTAWRMKLDPSNR